MRTIFSISLIILYVIALLRPVAPYIEYVMMKEYIIENYCENKDNPLMECNGLCHLGKQLKKVNDERPSGDSKPILNIEDFPYSLIPTAITNDEFSDENCLHLTSDNNNYSYLYSKSGFHPPEFV